MYRRPKFLELLLEIRREMALEADYDLDLFVGRLRAGPTPSSGKILGDTSPPARPMIDGSEKPAALKRAGKARKA